MEETLYHYQSNHPEEINDDISLTFDAEALVGTLKIEKTGNEHLIEATAPFSYECWCHVKMPSNTMLSEQIQVTLYLMLDTGNGQIMLIEDLEEGLGIPTGWEQDNSKESEAKEVVYVKDLELLRQQMDTLADIPLLKLPVVGGIAKSIQEEVKHTRFKNVLGYVIFDKVKSIVDIQKVNQLPEAEKDSITQQLCALAKILAMQHHDTVIAERILSFAENVQGVLPETSKMLANSQAEVEGLRQQIEQTAAINEADRKQWNLYKLGMWAGAVALFAYLLRKFFS